MALSNRNQVRLHIGDTDAEDPILTDAEVDNFLDQRSLVQDGGTVGVNIPAAAADCAGAIAAKYAREFDFSEDGQQFSRAQRVGHYTALEKTLRLRSGGYSVPLTLAGTETT